MAINQIIVNGSQTALSAGSNFLTQSGAVARHTFHRSLVLAEGESADAWREVTPAQKAQIEAEDEARMAPPRAFIDMWNAAWGDYGKYDPDNAPDPLHTFLGNDIWMTYEEAAMVLRESSGSNYLHEYCHAKSSCPTFLPMHTHAGKFPAKTGYAFAGNNNLKVVRFIDQNYIAIDDRTFYCCNSLRTIIGWGLRPGKADVFNLPSLESFTAIISSDLNLSLAANLTLSTIKTLIDSRAGTNAITITLHPEAYARVTEEIFEAAAAKNVTIASA